MIENIITDIKYFVVALSLGLFCKNGVDDNERILLPSFWKIHDMFIAFSKRYKLPIKNFLYKRKTGGMFSPKTLRYLNWLIFDKVIEGEDESNVYIQLDTLIKICKLIVKEKSISSIKHEEIINEFIKEYLCLNYLMVTEELLRKYKITLA